MTATAERPEMVAVRVWDAPTRLGHWLFVLLIALSWWTAQNNHMDWHRWSGYAILAILVFRIYWGFTGSGTARFSSFIKGPRATWRYARSLTRRTSGVVVGHNPLGAWSVMSLLTLMTLQVLLGLFSVDTDGIESGPLASYVSFDAGRFAATWHARIFNGLLVLMGLHVAAVLFYLAWKRENLIAPMLGGHRRYARETAPTISAAPPWRVALGVALSAAATWLVMHGLKLR